MVEEKKIIKQKSTQDTNKIHTQIMICILRWRPIAASGFTVQDEAHLQKKSYSGVRKEKNVCFLFEPKTYLLNQEISSQKSNQN